MWSDKIKNRNDNVILVFKEILLVMLCTDLSVFLTSAAYSVNCFRAVFFINITKMSSIPIKSYLICFLTKQCIAVIINRNVAYIKQGGRIYEVNRIIPSSPID